MAHLSTPAAAYTSCESEKHRDWLLARFRMNEPYQKALEDLKQYWVHCHAPKEFHVRFERYFFTPEFLAEQIGETPEWWAERLKDGKWFLRAAFRRAAIDLLANMEVIARHAAEAEVQWWAIND